MPSIEPDRKAEAIISSVVKPVTVNVLRDIIL